MTEEKKMQYAEFEVLTGINPSDFNFNKKEYYPHDGVFMLEHADGCYSIVNVVRGTSSTEYCDSFTQVGVGSRTTIDSGNVMDARDVNEKMDEMSKRYYESIEQEKKTLSAEFDKQRMELEHEYEVKRLQLEAETPKRFAQGEWVSGKTLTEIIKTLSGRTEA